MGQSSDPTVLRKCRHLAGAVAADMQKYDMSEGGYTDCSKPGCTAYFDHGLRSSS